MSSRRSKAIEARRKLADRRNGLAGSMLEEYDCDGGENNQDIYKKVDEKEYHELVEKRREREDFIVDDDGLGYHDDGEEVLGGERDHDDGGGEHGKKKRGKSNSLTKESLRKLRHSNAIASAKKKGGGSNSGNMWSFINKSGAAGANVSATSSSSKRKTNTFGKNMMSDFEETNFESMLESLDDDGDGNYNSGSSKRITSSSASKRKSSSSTSSSRPLARGRRPIQKKKKKKNNTKPLRQSYGKSRPTSASSFHGHRIGSGMDAEDLYNPANPNNEYHSDDDDDNDPIPSHAPFESTFEPTKFDSCDQNNNDDSMMNVDKNDESENTEQVVNQEEHTKSVATKLEDTFNSESTTTQPNNNNNNNNDDQQPIKKRRKLFSKSNKRTELSGPAQQALQRLKEKEDEEKKKKAEMKESTTSTTKTATSLLANASKFNFGNMDSISSATMDSKNLARDNASLEGVIQYPDQQEEGEEGNAEKVGYVDMFWIDAAEKDGLIYLFGKVKANNNNNSDDKDSNNTYVSCCAIVHNNVRNLFVLPRLIEDDNDETSSSSPTYANMMDVHKEIKSVLQPSCIPVKEGASWAGKVVQRKYAFEDSSIPREETNYLKVVYDAKYKTPSPEICENGGKHFSKIFGAGASPLETFLIKRNLMGPCWIRIQNPMAHNLTLSWAKIEFVVDSPKRVSRQETSINTPPPPVTTMSIHLKTVVNHKTHKAEIVSLSAICHYDAKLDAATDDKSTQHMMTQLSLIRPLGNSVAGAGAGGPSSLHHKFPRDFEETQKKHMPNLIKMTNERALLSRFVAQIGHWDPDIIVGHNACGYTLEVLLSRCLELKVNLWSKFGRRRQVSTFNKNSLARNKDWAIADVVKGRIVCDTYLSAKEFLNETTYSLTNLAETQLKVQRMEIDPVDVPAWFQSSEYICKLAQHTLFDAQLVQRLMFKLQILPLTRQLTCISGNMWSKTIRGNRSDRNEYLLLHEFHQQKYIVPEKKKKNKQGTNNSKGGKYSGGLVLEPKKGLYDSFILLLDFNSLYPSIIQEYNLCFTTVDWSGYMNNNNDKSQEDDNNNTSLLPPLPDESIKRGILPRVIKSLVERRRNVKKMMKSAHKNPEEYEKLDIRQKALKLTANSMYGCLGFSNSRFFAQPIAAMVTSMGRETLQRTVDIATDTVGLEVIYGDTDSIMINTHITDEKDLKKVKELGNTVKREVNKLYKTLELEIDGIFRSMLLLKKKKYAATTVEEKSNGELIYNQERKGLDLVRRDWCVQSKDSGHYVLDQILSRMETEVVVQNIHEHLEEIAKKMRAGELPLEKYVITKGLSKHPKEYGDNHGQAHVYVAKSMMDANKVVNVNDHIPYVITEPLKSEDENKASNNSNKSASQYARHPEEILRSAGALKPDVEWYLANQILPPISRLCDPIQGTSQSIMAEKLGLDSTKYNNSMSGTSQNEINEDDLVSFTPDSMLSDEERFKDVMKLKLTCSSCNETNVFSGIFHITHDQQPKEDDTTGDEQKKKAGSSSTLQVSSGFRCPNPNCMHPELWGESSHVSLVGRLSNALTIMHRKISKEYHSGVVKCNDQTCCLETNQLSVLGNTCLLRGCTGTLHSKHTEKSVHANMKYLDTLFDIDHACEQLEKFHKYNGSSTKDLVKSVVSPLDKVVIEYLHSITQDRLKLNAYNWVDPSFWQGLFNPKKQSGQQYKLLQ